MNKKKGFTLAEVLITLATIGVVSALTMPTLVQNVTNQKIGPSLSKFTNTFTNAAKLMMQDQQMPYLDDNVGADLILMAEHIDMVPLDTSSKSYKIYNGDNSTQYEVANPTAGIIEDMLLKDTADMAYDLNGDKEVNITDISFANAKGKTSAWVLKDGSVMIAQPLIRPIDLAGKGTYKRIIAEIFVDIDGNKSTNKAGTDVFGFLLDRNGSLIPAGSLEHKFIEVKGESFITAYNSTCNSKSATLNENFACTGKIANNNWSTAGLKLY